MELKEGAKPVRVGPQPRRYATKELEFGKNNQKTTGALSSQSARSRYQFTMAVICAFGALKGCRWLSFPRCLLSFEWINQGRLLCSPAHQRLDRFLDWMFITYDPRWIQGGITAYHWMNETKIWQRSAKLLCLLGLRNQCCTLWCDSGDGRLCCCMFGGVVEEWIKS